MNALVSIIVPAYNADKYIKFTIESILSQSYVNFELIVVDDGSKDNTSNIVLDYVKYDSRISYIYQDNSGTCSIPRNKGFAVSKGKYVTFFDADDIMSSDKIARQVAVMEAHPDVAAVFCNYRNFTSEGTSMNAHFSTCARLQSFLDRQNSCFCCGSYMLNSNESVDLLIDENFTIACSPMFKSAVFRSLGGYNTNLSASEDWYLHMLLFSQYRIALDSFVGFQRRIHDFNMSHNHQKIIEYKAISRFMAAKIVNNKLFEDRLYELASNYYYNLSLIFSFKSILLAMKYYKEGLVVSKKFNFYSLHILLKIIHNFAFKCYDRKK